MNDLRSSFGTILGAVSPILTIGFLICVDCTMNNDASIASYLSG